MIFQKENGISISFYFLRQIKGHFGIYFRVYSKFPELTNYKTEVLKDFVAFVAKNPQYESDLIDITALIDDNKDKAIEVATETINNFSEIYKKNRRFFLAAHHVHQHHGWEGTFWWSQRCTGGSIDEEEGMVVGMRRRAWWWHW